LLMSSFNSEVLQRVFFDARFRSFLKEFFTLIFSTATT